jgi:transposase-like protein
VRHEKNTPLIRILICKSNGGVFHLVKRVHYPEEIKWKAVEMKEEGYSNPFIMDTLGIKNVSQIKTWMRWYRTHQTYRFSQPVGKQ